MQAPTFFPYRGQQLWLSAERCTFWEEQRALIVSDLHFGKTGHFRKSGIAVPQAVYQEDLQRLLTQIQYFQPGQLILLGDFFHSRENKELQWFQKWRENFPDLAIQLVRGNHDILDPAGYQQTGISITEQTLVMPPFQFTHDIGQDSSYALSAGHYGMSGHIHPGIRIQGMGKQSLCLPCFYFGASYAVLPAFSRFTGVAAIEPNAGEHVFAIMPAHIGKKQPGGIIQIQ